MTIEIEDAPMRPRDRVLAHLDSRPVDHLPAMPLSMMFAARFAGVRYLDYCTDYRVLAAAQVAVANRFGFDHVSAISDPAREAVDLGAEVTWFPDQPPALDDTRSLLADPARLASLAVADPLATGRMADRVRGVGLLRALSDDRIVEGWVEGPCAEAADLRGISTIMTDFGDDPGFIDDLFGFTTRQATAFARAQVDAGADIIGVGDAAASLVGPAIYREVVLPHEQALVDAIHAMGARVRLHICGNTRRSVADMARSGADIIDLDSLDPLAQARLDAGPRQVLLGNLNPVTQLLSSTPEAVTARVAECHRDAGERFVVGAGCEIPAATPHENIDAMTSYARAWRPDRSPVAAGSGR